MFENDNVRKGLYVLAVAIGAALMVFGFVDQDTADQIVRIAAGALLGGVGELARRHVGPRPATISADGVAQVITDAIAQHTPTLRVIAPTVHGSAAEIAAAVDRTRTELAAGLARRWG